MYLGGTDHIVPYFHMSDDEDDIDDVYDYDDGFGYDSDTGYTYDDDGDGVVMEDLFGEVGDLMLENDTELEHTGGWDEDDDGCCNAIDTQLEGEASWDDTWLEMADYSVYPIAEEVISEAGEDANGEVLEYVDSNVSDNPRSERNEGDRIEESEPEIDDEQEALGGFGYETQEEQIEIMREYGHEEHGYADYQENVLEHDEYYENGELNEAEIEDAGDTDDVEDVDYGDDDDVEDGIDGDDDYDDEYGFYGDY